MTRPVEIDRIWDAADPVAEVLHTLQMSGAFYSRAHFTAPWGLELPPMPGHLMFHVVTGGECWIDSEDLVPFKAAEGDFVLLPRGEGHALRSEPGHPTTLLWDTDREQISDRYELLTHVSGGDVSTTICGAVRIDHPAAQHLIAFLPPAIHLEASGSARDVWMESTVGLILHEAAELRPGGEWVITRLADLLVVQAIRTWLQSEGAAKGWVGALRDRDVGRGLRLIHRNPERGWTVDSLARELHMSRAAFSRRFSQLVGEPPMAYLTRWRMQLAVAWLRSGEVRVADLPSRLGYGSEAAFGRAFKRELGVSPGSLLK